MQNFKFFVVWFDLRTLSKFTNIFFRKKFSKNKNRSKSEFQKLKFRRWRQIQKAKFLLEELRLKTIEHC